MATATGTARATTVPPNPSAIGSIRLAAVAAFLLLAGLGSLIPSPAGAATILVTSAADSGAGSLRQAVLGAAAGDTIAFDSAVAGATITLTSGPITVSRNLIINAQGRSITVSGNNSLRVFTVAAGTVTLSHLTIANGNGGSGGNGGGIWNTGGDVTVQSCTITGCRAGLGAGIFNGRNLTVTNSTFSGNTATSSGGGIYSSGTSLSVNNCTFSTNSAASGSGADIHNNAAGINLRNSILADKLAGASFNCRGVLATNLNNLIEDGSCAPLLSGDPSLGPLQDNGGDTATMALLTGSPAIDQADPATADAADQRGIGRDADPDIGAYEVARPDLEVRGNGIAIADGDTTPAAADGTDFGGAAVAGATVARVFSVHNTGNAALNLTGTPRVALTGAHSGDFGVTVQPATPVAAGGSTTVTIRFAPSATGVRSAAVALSSDDPDENPYTFSIAGTGTAIPVRTLSVALSGPGGGTVTSTPAGIDCGFDCSEDFTDAAAVTLSAAADAGSVFSGWSGGGCSGSGDCTVILTADTTVTAGFSDAATDADADGVADAQEQGPGFDNAHYDGNGDGVADWLQTNVVSTPNDDGRRYMTLAVPAPVVISVMDVNAQPPAAGLPAGMAFPYGFFSFTLTNVAAGGSVTATLILEPTAAPLAYYKYGYTPEHPADHWYPFSFDGTTGARIEGHVITLHLVDGLRGDADLDGTNGVIVDPGGPAVDTVASDSTDGGCFVSASAR